MRILKSFLSLLDTLVSSFFHVFVILSEIHRRLIVYAGLFIYYVFFIYSNSLNVHIDLLQGQLGLWLRFVLVHLIAFDFQFSSIRGFRVFEELRAENTIFGWACTSEMRNVRLDNCFWFIFATLDRWLEVGSCMQSTSWSVFGGEGSELYVKLFLLSFHGFDSALNSTNFFIKLFTTL